MARAARLKHQKTDYDRFRLGGNVSYVYFMLSQIKNMPAIKVGRSWHPTLRAQKVRQQTRRPIIVLSAYACTNARSAHALEAKIHQRFAAYRIRGEWFEPVAELLELADKADKGKA